MHIDRGAERERERERESERARERERQREREREGERATTWSDRFELIVADVSVPP